MKLTEHRRIVGRLEAAHQAEIRALEARLANRSPQIEFADNPATLGELDALRTANERHATALDTADRLISALEAVLRAHSGEAAVAAAHRIAADLDGPIPEIAAEAFVRGEAPPLYNRTRPMPGTQRKDQGL